jgi:hypothetical protein
MPFFWGQMQSYRLYRLDANNRIMNVTMFEGPDDQAAIAEAVRLDHANSIEIWCGPRKVGLVDPETGRMRTTDTRKPAG